MILTPEAEIAQFLRRLKWAAVIVGVLWVVSLLSPILTPFVLALLLAWLGDPLVDRIERAGRSRNMAVTLVFILMVLLVVLALMILVPMMERQIMTLIDALPQMRDWAIGTAIPWLQRRTGVELMGWLDPERLIEWIRSHWEQAGGVAKTFFGYVSRSGFAMVTWVINLALLPILAFYFLRDWDRMVERVAAVIPRAYIGTVSRLALESNDVLGGFIRGQFLVMLALGAIYATGLSIIGLNLGLLIGVGVVFTVGQLLESYVLTPRIVGDKIGLHPVAVIFAVMAGGQLFGFLGMLLALPVAAVANVLLRYAHERYTQSDLYAGERAGIVLQSGPERSVIIDASKDADRS